MVALDSPATAAALVLEFTDNRLAGLLREISEAIEQEDDPDALRRFGLALFQLHHEARGKAWESRRNQSGASY